MEGFEHSCNVKVAAGGCEALRGRRGGRRFSINGLLGEKKKKQSVFFLSCSKMKTGPFALCCLRAIERERKSGGSCKEKPQMEKTREPSDRVCETALWLLLFFCNDDFERETLYRRCWSDCTFLTHFAPLKVQSFLFSIISSH